jgi:hypothetical protein
MNERDVQLPRGPSMMTRLGRLLSSGLVIAGLLLMGAGICCAVFCYHLFTEAAQIQGTVDFARNEARRLEKEPPGTTLPFNGAPLDRAGWLEVARRQEPPQLLKTIDAYKNVSVSIGLFLGGTSLCLLGFCVRPCRIAVPLAAEPDPLLDRPRDHGVSSDAVKPI